jgi:hypothetical protein
MAYDNVQRSITGDVIAYQLRLLNDPLSTGELRIRTNGRPPLERFQRIMLIDNKKVKFHGYLENYAIKKSNNELTYDYTFREQFGILANRYLMPFNYTYQPIPVPFWAFIFDSAPLDSWDNRPPGLIYVANSLIPPGLDYEIYDEANEIIKYPGMGTNSRFGTKSIRVLDPIYGASVLTEQSHLLDLESNNDSIYRDSEDLYVKSSVEDGYIHQYGIGKNWYNQSSIFVDEWADTFVRVDWSNVDDFIDLIVSGKLLPTGNESILSILINMSLWEELVPKWDHRVDGITYLTLSLSEES